MTLKEISDIRLISQRIGRTGFRTASEVVSWMGAMQAQDYPMAKWALGIRTLDPDDAAIEASFSAGSILRTHLMRPTWHFVPAEDIYWMLELTAPHVKASMKSREKRLELTEAIFKKSRSILIKNLEGGKCQSRDILSDEFRKAGIQTDGNRLSHLLARSELDGLICSGPVLGGKQTYAMLDERVRLKKQFTRDESLAELAKRYFTSHCPATLKDFLWWSGLTVRDAKRGYDFIKSGFVEETVGTEKYFFPESYTPSGKENDSCYLLPAYDEYLISYKDRTASLSSAFNTKAVSSNGIFYPVIVMDGQVKGIWKRSFGKDKIIIEVPIFEKLNKASRALVERALTIMGIFLVKPLKSFTGYKWLDDPMDLKLKRQ